MDDLEWEALIKADILGLELLIEDDILIKANIFKDMEAQCILAVMYHTGHGIRKNLKKAFEWYLKSAEQGHIVAQKNLGLLYFEGNGVEQNYNNAAEWFIKSAEQGDVIAQFNLGFLYMEKEFESRNFNRAYEWILRSFKNGHSDAFKALATLCHAEGVLWDYRSGDYKNVDIRKIKVKENVAFTCQDNTYSLSAKEFERIVFEAEFGDTDAQYMLGVMLFCGYLLDGNIIKCDYSQATQWFSKASSSPGGHKSAYEYECALSCDGIDWHDYFDAQNTTAELSDLDYLDDLDYYYLIHKCEGDEYAEITIKINDIIKDLEKVNFDDIVARIRKVRDYYERRNGLEEFIKSDQLMIPLYDIDKHPEAFRIHETLRYLWQLSLTDPNPGECFSLDDIPIRQISKQKLKAKIQDSLDELKLRYFIEDIEKLASEIYDVIHANDNKFEADDDMPF